MFYKLFHNKYVFYTECILKDILSYGFINTVKIQRRNKLSDYSSFKNSFKDRKSVEIFRLIEKRAGDNLKIDTAFNLGYCMYGPVIFDFIQWLDKKADSYNKLLFLSREGWLLKTAFKMASDKSIETEYFLASRRAASVAAIENRNDIKEILSLYYKGSLKNLLYARLGVEYKGDDFYVEMPSDIEKVISLIDISQVLEIAENERQNYKSYCDKIIKNNDKAAVVDIGYSGTIQMYLNRVLKRNVEGLYLCLHYKSRALKSGYKCDSLFNVCNMFDEGRNKIFKNQLYLEAVLKAPFGQFVCFDNDCNPVYNNDNSFDDITNEIQKGIYKFIKDMRKLRTTSEDTFSAELFDFIIRNKRIDSNLIKKLSVEDSYCSDGIISFLN